MFAYGLTASNAIAIMSYLAGHPGRLVSSGEVAENRGMTKAFAAKLMTQLAAAGLVSGRPGPRGGYLLAKPPGTITLMDIVRRFELVEEPSRCPFGRGWCGHGDPCPIHDQLADLHGRTVGFLETTTLAAFAPAG